jgi:hypothetical protein
MKNYIPPTYTIPLKNWDDYTEVMRFCRTMNIKFMIYCFTWKGIVWKYGIQHKQGGTGNDFGERIYTQIGHIPGWTKPNLKRCPATKRDIDEVINKIQTTYRCEVVKDDIVVEIMDYTNAPFEIDNPRGELQRIEDAMVEAHLKTHGYSPIGNKTKPVKKKTPLWRTTGLFDIK